MLKPGHKKFCFIHKKNDKYIFKNFRDFNRHNEEKNKQNWINREIHSQKITGLNLYIIPFALRNIVGHSILEFTFDDGNNIFLSVEGEQKTNQEYSVWKAIYPGYRIRYIWGSKKDIIGLRTKIRKEKLYRYPIHMQPKFIQELFENLVTETNASTLNNKAYGLLFNNCTSSVRNVARKSFHISRRHIGLIFNAFLPKYLDKLDILKREEKEVIE